MGAMPGGGPAGGEALIAPNRSMGGAGVGAEEWAGMGLGVTTLGVVDALYAGTASCT